MPKFVRAHPPPDDSEARKIRRLVGAGHASADWSERARIITLSWKDAFSIDRAMGSARSRIDRRHHLGDPASAAPARRASLIERAIAPVVPHPIRFLYYC